MTNHASSDKIEKALAKLKALIATGVEFPDAEWKVISKEKLNAREADELRAIYDEA